MARVGHVVDRHPADLCSRVSADLVVGHQDVAFERGGAHLVGVEMASRQIGVVAADREVGDVPRSVLLAASLTSSLPTSLTFLLEPGM